jgi:(2Fe-2S) ferredoxin
MYQKHLFICVNKRDNGDSACHDFGSKDLHSYTKQLCKHLNLDNVRVNQAGCLGQCSHGPVVVVYPQGNWYSVMDEADMQTIVQEDLMNNQSVKSLLIKN